MSVGQWEAALDQHLLAAVLKDCGLTYDQIGSALGISASKARRSVLAGPRAKIVGEPMPRSGAVTAQGKARSR